MFWPLWVQNDDVWISDFKPNQKEEEEEEEEDVVLASLGPRRRFGLSRSKTTSFGLVILNLTKQKKKKKKKKKNRP